MHENNTTTTRLPGAAYDDDSAAPGDAATIAAPNRDALTEILLDGAQRLLRQAIDADVTDWIERHAGLTNARGRRQVVRHGHHPACTLVTGSAWSRAKLWRRRACLLLARSDDLGGRVECVLGTSGEGDLGDGGGHDLHSADVFLVLYGNHLAVEVLEVFNRSSHHHRAMIGLDLALFADRKVGFGVNISSIRLAG